MRRFVCFALSFLLWISLISAQSTKTFDCGLFSLEYPSVFKPATIQNAPHMVLKLESDNYYLSASYWDKGLDSEISIWDDELYDLYKQNPVADGTLVSITKESIQTKGGSRRCLILKTNIYRSYNGKTVNLKMVSYLMINGGYLFTFAFMSEGKYTKDSPTSYPDKVMKGLKFKELKKNTSDFDNYLIEVVKKMNKQCPMEVDACTTYKQVLLSGNSIMIKTLIPDECNMFVDYNEFKKKMCENFRISLEKGFVQYLEKKGYSVVYMIYNENDRLKNKVTITGSDILRYY